MWQAEADKELTLSAWPATAVGEQTLTRAKRRYSTVHVVTEVGSIVVEANSYSKICP